MKQRRREILCDRQMDISPSVNQISRGGGGGDAAVAPLAYFPPFTSQFILLGALEVQYMDGVQPRLACHRKTAKKWLHSGGGGLESVSTLTVHKEGTRAKMVQSFLVSIFTLSIYSHSTALCACVCVCFFAAWLSWDPADVSVVWIPERRCRYGEADWHISTLFSYFPSHSFSLPLSYPLGSCQWLSYTRYSSVIIKVEGSLTLQCPQVFCFFYAEECTQTQRKVEMRTQISLKAF